MGRDVFVRDAKMGQVVNRTILFHIVATVVPAGREDEHLITIIEARRKIVGCLRLLHADTFASLAFYLLVHGGEFRLVPEGRSSLGWLRRWR